MIKIYKNEETKETLKEISNIEKDCWIDLLNPTKDEIAKVLANVNIDKKTITEVLVEKDLPRIKKTKFGTLMVIDIPYQTESKEYNTYSMGIIICNDFHIITVSLKENSILQHFIKNEIPNFYTAKKSRFCLQIFEETSKEYLRALNKIETKIEPKEQQLLNSTSNKQLMGLLTIEKSLVYFITSLKYNNTVLEKISKEYVIDIYEEDKEFLEDTIIDNKQCIEMSTIYREILSSTIATYGTIISNNLNEAMRFLASITIVFSIPTMVASFLGMNVPLGILATNKASFLLIFILSIVISIIIAIWLKKRKLF